MFKEMRRKEKLMLEESSLYILDTAEYGVFSSISENGYPYGVPVNYVLIENSIYIHGALEGHRLENIRRESKSSFIVVANAKLIPSKFDTEYDSVICFGSSYEVMDDFEKEVALLEFVKKYSPEYLESGKKYLSISKKDTKVIRMDIEHKSGKKGR